MPPVDLIFNQSSRFTTWAVAAGLPREPIVVVDVGVQGGEHQRWNLFPADRIVVHGFDAIRGVVEGLRQQARPGRHYHWMAVGDHDGETQFYFNAADPYSSSVYGAGPSAYAKECEHRAELQRVPLRQLDSLVLDGTVPQPDFLKVDVEGFEQSVLVGAKKALGSRLLGFEVETSLNASPVYLETHFGVLLDIATKNGMRAVDLNFNRIPTESFQRALEDLGRSRVRNSHSVGKISTMNVLFLRDLVAERDSPVSYQKLPPPPSLDQVVKTMMLLESYGLNDIAIDVAQRFKDDLAPLMDVDAGIRLLADPNCRIDESIGIILRSYARTMSAPLKMARGLLKGASRRLRRA